VNAVARILEDTVAALCPDIADELDQSPAAPRPEQELWRTLLTCVLSSQVPYSVATAAAEASLTVVTESGKGGGIDRALIDILSKPLPCGRRYRFPELKGRQIATTHARLKGEGLALSDIVADTSPDHHLRQRLMVLVDGFGPKQSSMFLRDIGRSMSLAVLDRHVLEFMDRLGLAPMPKSRGIGLAEYFRREQIFARFAERLGFSVGCVDWAVWIAMRAARQEKLL
jgi:N-glycosylase/DNA lyase